VINTVVRAGLSIAVSSAALIVGGVGSANAAGYVCHSEFRGNTACIEATAGQIWATGNYSPNSTVFLEIVDANTGKIVDGPYGVTSLRSTLPPGRYSATYSVESNSASSPMFTEVDSPVVTIG